MIDLNLNPNLKDLRIFAALQVVFFGVIAGLMWNKSGETTVPSIIVSVSLAVGVIGCLAPALVRWIYVVWMVAVFPIGWIVSHVVAGIVFYLVITPIGLAMRLLGRDPLRRQFDPNAESYWIDHAPAEDPQRYFRQF